MRSRISSAVSADGARRHRLGLAGVHLGEHPDRRAQLAGRAVAALERVVLDERLLQRMQLVVVREPLDGRHLGAIVRDREREACVRPAPVDQHGAGAALAVIAALLRAREAQVLAQQVEQRRARVDEQAALDAVDHERERRAHGRIGGGGRSHGSEYPETSHRKHDRARW